MSEAIDAAAKWLCESVKRSRWDDLLEGRAGDHGFDPWDILYDNARRDDFRDAVREILRIAEARLRDIDDALAASTTQTSGQPESPENSPNRQAEILKWAIATFGAVAANKTERVLRFLEEAIELAHSLQLPAVSIRDIAARVYDRPPGAPQKEIGQAAMTLEALAELISVSVERECAAEWERVRTIPADEWARRHVAKQKIGITADALTTGQPESPDTDGGR